MTNENRMQTRQDAEILNATQLAEFLGVSIDTVYSWTMRKAIPHFKIGKMLRFDRAEIVRWMQSKKVELYNEGK